MTLSIYLSNLLLDKVFANEDFNIGTTYLSFHSSDPGTTGGYEIITGGGYREVVICSGAFGGEIYNVNEMLYSDVIASGIINYAGLWDAQDGGNYLMGGVMASGLGVTVAAGDNLIIHPGSIVIRMV
jgi:hypothetical protein